MGDENQYHIYKQVHFFQNYLFIKKEWEKQLNYLVGHQALNYWARFTYDYLTEIVQFRTRTLEVQTERH